MEDIFKRTKKLQMEIVKIEGEMRSIKLDAAKESVHITTGKPLSVKVRNILITYET